jgi:hypothetical protein
MVYGNDESDTLCTISDSGRPQTENGPQGLLADRLYQMKFKAGFFTAAPMLFATISGNSDQESALHRRELA